MTRDEFFQYVADLGYEVRLLSDTDTLIRRILRDGTSDIWAEMWVYASTDGEIRLGLPTPWQEVVPGKPGMLRLFLLPCRDWRETAGVAGELLRRFDHFAAMNYHPTFHNTVAGTIPGVRLICHDGYAPYVAYYGTGKLIAASDRVPEIVPPPDWILPVMPKY